MNLNLGCGRNKKKGYINIDKDPTVSPDLVWDLEQGLPYDDNTVDSILIVDFLEHVENYIKLFNEMYRVCKNGAEIYIIVPYALCDAAHDIDHRSYWTERKFRQLVDNYYSYSGFTGKMNIRWMTKLNRDIETDMIYVRLGVIK